MSSVGYRPSIVEYIANERGRSCGYCHSKDTSYSSGIWAHTMTVEDYQDLIDRGWRRSGQHCYKPVMTSTCCPMYTIRCAAGDFKVSKSQKRILKRFNKFLAYGVIDKSIKPSILKNTEILNVLDAPGVECNIDLQNNKNLDLIVTRDDKLQCEEDTVEGKETVINDPQPVEASGESVGDRVAVKSGNKCRQMKAKYLRIERKKQKLRNMGLSEEEIQKKLVEKKKKVTIKTVEDYLEEPEVENPAHKLEIKLVRSFPSSSEFEETYEDVFELYKRYQTEIHKDPPEKLTHRQFQRFLVVSPLKIRLVLVNSPEFDKTFGESASLFAKYQKAVHNESDDDCSVDVFNDFLVDSPLEPAKFYGSYHQQYWLDGKLIAVGVVDILPRCISSVYFLYDPDYMYLSLGTYGALREVEFVRKLTSQYQDLKYYYMGFYIHSCVKMRYKAAFRPSYLLCPEAYTWHPIQSCLRKIDVAKYSRFNEDPSVKDSNSNIILPDVSILYNKIAMSFGSYAKQKKCSAEEREEILRYATLVGMICAKRMLLYRT